MTMTHVHGILGSYCILYCLEADRLIEHWNYPKTQPRYYEDTLKVLTAVLKMRNKLLTVGHHMVL